MAESTFTEMELCNLVERTLDNVITPNMSREVRKVLYQFGMRLLELRSPESNAVRKC